MASTGSPPPGRARSNTVSNYMGLPTSRQQPSFVCSSCKALTRGVIEIRYLRETPGGQRRRIECENCKRRSTVFTLPEKRYQELVEAERRMKKVLSALGNPKIFHEQFPDGGSSTDEKRCPDCGHYGPDGCRFAFPDAEEDETFASECNLWQAQD